MTIKKAVITAAARGDRLYPVADTVQKAMLPVVDIDGINKPVIQIIAEEAFASGVEEICIVCAPGDDKRYVESFNTLQSSIISSFKNSAWSEKQIAAISNLLDRLTFAVQDEPKGYGHAVYSSKEFVKDDPFLLMLGDYLYVSGLKDKSCTRQLLELAENENCSAAAVNPTIEHQISRYGTLTGKILPNKKGVYQIEKIIEKPSVSLAELELLTPGLRTGYYLCFFGMHVFKHPFFDLLSEYATTSTNNILLTPVLQMLAENEKYLAVEIKGNRYDTSKEFGLTHAQLALALAGVKRDDMLASLVQLLAEAKE